MITKKEAIEYLLLVIGDCDLQAQDGLGEAWDVTDPHAWEAMSDLLNKVKGFINENME